MADSCVILCSVRKPTTDSNRDAVNRLRAEFLPFPPGERVDTYIVREDAAFVDGGNGGGGDSSKALKFVAGVDQRGVWNFRYNAQTFYDNSNRIDRDQSFPPAARIELCIPIETITSAMLRLANDYTGEDRLDYLADVFENVVLVPFSQWNPEAKSRKGKVVVKRDDTNGSTGTNIALILR